MKLNSAFSERPHFAHLWGGVSIQNVLKLCPSHQNSPNMIQFFAYTDTNSTRMYYQAQCSFSEYINNKCRLIHWFEVSSTIFRDTSFAIDNSCWMSSLNVSQIVSYSIDFSKRSHKVSAEMFMQRQMKFSLVLKAHILKHQFITVSV